MMKSILSLLLLFVFTSISSQTNETISSSISGIPISPQNAEGYPIKSVIILLHKDNKLILTDSLENDAFYKAFNIKPGGVFRQALADLALAVIEKQNYLKSAKYIIYNSGPSEPVTVVMDVYFLKAGEQKVVAGNKGIIPTNSIQSFPLLLETSHSKISFILNGGLGLFNESNALFGRGPEFTKGNPIADNPAVKGERFWGEMNIETGLGGVFKIGKSNTYAYGAGSVMFTGRNTSDIYSNSSAIYADVERLYAGLLFTKLGKNKHTILDISYGRQFFQLNDGFLISRFSGSANAGPRGGVYLNSRTTFQKSGLMKLQSGKWTMTGFYLEPQELFKDKQSNTGYAGLQMNYNNNKTIDAGITYINLISGTSKYGTPQGSIAKKGMYIINPKIWLTNISGTGLFLKSEMALQYHSSENMKSNAWYIGAGLNKNKWKLRPSFYYRYAYMKGDDSTTSRFEKFDPMLTGGLGNWVQGIDFRKVSGNGNMISHRVEIKIYPSKTFELSFDYFHLSANTYSNLGALSPISKLKAKTYGQEFTLNSRYFLSNHFMLLTILSYAKPGDAIKTAFVGDVHDWTSIQASLFMFF